MEIIHVSAECYPVAKAGGLGDVVGALPKYQNKLGHVAKVVMPMYRTKFLYQNTWETVHESGTYLGSQWFRYAIIKETTNKLGFDLYLVDINGLLDREEVYGYPDDSERFLAFQIAIIHWISQWQHLPDVLHCHDHHTAFIPFILKYSYGIDHLRSIKTVLTIHNAQYQGWMGWDKMNLIPSFDNWKSGFLDWNHMINPLASGIRCADKVTTVSQSYLQELSFAANGIEKLFEYEKGKCSGILNGIDNEVWNPTTDSYLEHHYTIQEVAAGKAANKQWICNYFKLEVDKPLIIFIGRLVGEKAAELLPQAIGDAIVQCKGFVNFLILGSGDPAIETQLQNMVPALKYKFNCYIGYNEQLAHRMYAAADFLLMPSKVEPCGLNQMYALRYGTVPMVRRTGGLKDTVTDIGQPNFEGFGICFDNATAYDVTLAISRAVGWYYDRPDILTTVQKKIMTIDHSWESSAAAYLRLYGVEENQIRFFQASLPKPQTTSVANEIVAIPQQQADADNNQKMVELDTEEAATATPTTTLIPAKETHLETEMSIEKSQPISTLQNKEEGEIKTEEDDIATVEREIFIAAENAEVPPKKMVTESSKSKF